MRASGADLIWWSGPNPALGFDRFLVDLGDIPRAMPAEGIDKALVSKGARRGRTDP